MFNCLDSVVFRKFLDEFLLSWVWILNLGILLVDDPCPSVFNFFFFEKITMRTFKHSHLMKVDFKRKDFSNNFQSPYQLG